MKLAFIITGQVLLMVVAGVGLYVGYGWVDSQRRDFLYTQAVATGQLTQQSFGLATAGDLAKYRQDIAAVRAIVIFRDDLVKVVSSIEEEAARAGVAFTVPVVSEVKKLDENGVPMENTGPIFDVRLQIAATGDPVKLLRFTQAVEDLPYLLTLATVKMQTSTTNQNGVVVNAPDAAAAAVSGQLAADIVVTVRQNNLSPAL